MTGKLPTYALSKSTELQCLRKVKRVSFWPLSGWYESVYHYKKRMEECSRLQDPVRKNYTLNICFSVRAYKWWMLLNGICQRPLLKQIPLEAPVASLSIHGHHQWSLKRCKEPGDRCDVCFSVAFFPPPDTHFALKNVSGACMERAAGRGSRWRYMLGVLPMYTSDGSICWKSSRSITLMEGYNTVWSQPYSLLGLGKCYAIKKPKLRIFLERQ